MEPPLDPPPTPESVRKLPRISPRIRRAAGTAVILLGAVILAGIATSYAGARQYRWRGFDLEVAVRPAMEGRTRLIFTPLGDVKAVTHSAPVELRVALRGISFDEAKTLALNPPPREDLERDFLRTARLSLQRFALTQVLIGFLAALLAPLIARSRRASHWIGSGLFGAGSVAVSFYVISATYNPKAFENPTYTGSLKEARWIIGLAKDGFARAEALSERLKRVAANVSALYGRLESAAPLLSDEDVIRVLHISDIHNNAAALGFVRELAEGTRIDLIIDTGDLTDLGLPVETELIRGISTLRVPYVFVAGNHDSRTTVAAVSGFPGSRILDGEVIEVAGLRILGAPDPSSRRVSSGSVDTPDHILKSESIGLSFRVSQMVEPPDVLCVHNPKQAESLIGKVPVVLYGHMHRAEVVERNGTVICNAGTTGGAGVRFFDRKGGVPFTAAILGFTRNPKPRLAFIDQVSLEGSLGEYSITRKSFSRVSDLSDQSDDGGRVEQRNLLLR